MIVVRKVGVPWQPELAMGAVGENGACIVNQDVVRRARIDPDGLAGAAHLGRHPGTRGGRPGRLGITARAPGHPDTERTIWMGGAEVHIRDWQYCEDLLGWISWPEDVRRQAWQEDVVLTPTVDHALTEFSETVDTLVRLCGAAERPSTALPASAVLNLPRKAPIEAVFQRLDRLADLARIQYERTAQLVARQLETVPATVAAPQAELPGPNAGHGPGWRSAQWCWCSPCGSVCRAW